MKKEGKGRWMGVNANEVWVRLFRHGVKGKNLEGLCLTWLV